jgi:hypothetical protein
MLGKSEAEAIDELCAGDKRTAALTAAPPLKFTCLGLLFASAALSVLTAAARATSAVGAGAAATAGLCTVTLSIAPPALSRVSGRVSL